MTCPSDHREAGRVDTYPIDDGTHHGGRGTDKTRDVDPHCTVCGDRIDDGEHRQYADHEVGLERELDDTTAGRGSDRTADHGPDSQRDRDPQVE